MTLRSSAARWLLAVVLVLAVGACGQDGSPRLERSAARAVTQDARGPDEEATDAGRRFLDRYVADDGRVVRRDQGGDTVSEGQAYGMLVAVALDDRRSFDRIWTWTRQHLLTPDGLLAWRWADGTVADSMPATDADVDTAHALALAADRFRDPSYAADASTLAAAVVEHEVVPGRLGPVAVAGPWATEGRWVNPSYGDPAAYASLAVLTGDATWRALDDAARRVATGSRTSTDLVADWAVLRDDAIEISGPPSGGEPLHSYDAARVAIRFALDCDPAGRDIAARMTDEYDDALLDGGVPAGAIDLDGAPRSRHGHPAMTVAMAAAAAAADEPDAAGRILDRATAQAVRTPTYFGDAWLALGRLWLTTDRLDGCGSR